MSTSFFGINLHSSLKGYNAIIISGNHLERRQLHKSKRWCTVSAKHGNPMRQAFRFCGQNVNLLRTHLVSISGSRLKCTKKPPFSPFIPLWKEGIFFIRAYVYTVVISGLCLLIWFGRNKAKGYIEASLLPYVCSVISDYIQRDVHFGKVIRISPLSVTLESCSFGPHKEEFSCGEAPTVKLRLHPFASLRRGKFVVDAVLSHPSILVVQKKDYSWLGIPYTEGGGMKRHLSTEEGIDHRTRVRRLAREEAAARSARERDDAASKAAEMGYFVSEHSQGDDLKEVESHSRGETDSNSFFCMNEVKHDHHCVDKGVDYDMKHADLEKSFGVKFPGSGLKFWSRVLKGHWKHKFKRKAMRSDISASGAAVKRKIFERSALAACTYFRSQSHGKFGEPSPSSGCVHFMNRDMHLVKSEVDKTAESVESGDDNRSDDSQNGAQFRDLGIWSPSENENVNGRSDDLKFVSDPILPTKVSKHENLQFNEDVTEHARANSSIEKKEKPGLHVAHNPIDINATGGQRGLVPEDLASLKLKPRPQLAMHFQVLLEPLIVKLGLISIFRNIEELTSGFLSGLTDKSKSEVVLRVKDIVADHVDGTNVLQSEGLTKILPVTLDSVHFRGATVMLLAYGDSEVREMENVNGHMKFHNHYSRINVQLSGNFKTWRSGGICEDGGWLLVNVFVDTTEQKWHANLKIDNLFVPLFERILEIPITWSKGRASGSLVHVKG